MRDLHNNIDVKPAWDPIDLGSGDTPKVSEIVDRAGFGSVELLLSFGSIADSDATFTLLIEDGDDSALADNASVADVNLNGTEALAAPLFSDDNKVFKIGYSGPKRYVRATLTPSGNTGAILTSAVWVLGNPEQSPTANPPA